IGEGLLGNVLLDDGFPQRYENRMRRLAFVTGVQFVLPPVEQFECAVWIGNFVAKIIGPAAVGVDVVKMLVQGSGKKPRYNFEILIVMSGQPARVALRLFGRATGLGGMPRDVDFAGAQHQEGTSSNGLMEKAEALEDLGFTSHQSPVTSHRLWPHGQLDFPAARLHARKRLGQVCQPELSADEIAGANVPT